MSTVSAYMNPKLVYVRDGDHPKIALRPMLELGLSTVPVLDEEHKPVGFLSLRDLVDHRDGHAPRSIGVRSVTTTDSIESAAKVMLEAGVHHLVVLDEHGVAVGMLSTLDVMAALVGAPPIAHSSSG